MKMKFLILSFLPLMLMGLLSVGCSDSDEDDGIEPIPLVLHSDDITERQPDNETDIMKFVCEGKTWSGIATREYGMDDPFTYKIEGDTVISGRKYKKVYLRYQHVYADVLYHYYGAVSESANKVYIMVDGSSEPVLLYDFNLQIGDSFRYFDYVNETVVDIEKTVLHDVEARVFIFDEFYAEGSSQHQLGYVIEGIGGTRSPFDPWGWGRDGVTLKVTECKVNGQVIYEQK